MAGHGRTSWDDVAVVTVSILRLVARCEKQNGEPASLSRREMAKVVGVSEYRVHAAIRRLVGSGLVSSEARYRDEAYRTKSVSHLGASTQVDAPFSFV